MIWVGYCKTSFALGGAGANYHLKEQYQTALYFLTLTILFCFSALKSKQKNNEQLHHAMLES